MNCSAVPVTLSTDETYNLLCKDQPKNERKLLHLFSTFSDTMQFTEKLRIQNRLHVDYLVEKYAVKTMLKTLINKRYFTRTIRLLQLPSGDALIEAFCSSLSSMTTTPNRQLLSNLHSLTIKRSNTLQNEQLKTICSLCPFLEKLSIPGQTKLTDKGAEFFSNLKRLHSLDLTLCESITDDGLEHLAKLPSLQSLNLYKCKKVTDSGLQHLAKLSSLQTLNLASCNKITDTGLQHLAKILPLETLNLGGCNKITDEGCHIFFQSTKIIR